MSGEEERELYQHDEGELSLELRLRSLERLIESKVSSNGNGVMGNLPVWAKIITWIGLPAFFAIILLGVLLGTINSPLQKINSISEKLDQHLTDSRRSDEQQIKIIRQICRNTSKTELASIQCENL